MSDQSKYFEHQRTEMLKYVPASVGAVLDVGCAAGGFGSLLKNKFGCTVWGIEPNKDAASVAATKLDKVYNSFFHSEIDLEDKKFDVIFFNDVLEHLPDPWNALHTARKFLNQGGCVVASIPNILHFEIIYKILKERDWKYEDAGVMDRTHLRFFTKKSIIRMFEDCGFRVDVIEGINPYFFRFIYYLNKFTFNRFDELKYPQFAVRAIA
jgi:2-polyprenyl-3-methyl-5-hydroxy-6-metoxy-1,4-benzoquinol methylase